MPSNKQNFIDRLNAKINNSQILVVEHSINKDAFTIQLTNTLIEIDQLTPSKELVDIITNEAKFCYGLDIKFNLSNSVFWVDIEGNS